MTFTDQLDATWFTSKAGYDALVSAITNHPELYFYIAGTTNSHNIIDFYVFSSDALSSVNANFDLIYANCALYNSEWGQDFDIYHCRMVDGNPTFQCVGANPSNIKTFDTFDELLACDWNYNTSVASATMMRTDNIKWDITQAKWLVSSKPGAINCYKSADDMKKDLASQVVGTYTPDYTGTTAKTVSQDTVTNITNNYYNGGSSGSDDSNGGSSSGGIFDDIISGIANGVGSIIKGIFSIIKDLVDAIADAIVSITKSITDLMGLLKGDFTSFLSAVFPFMPQEFITIMVASLALCLLGVIIKIFKG